MWLVQRILPLRTATITSDRWGVLLFSVSCGLVENFAGMTLTKKELRAFVALLLTYLSSQISHSPKRTNALRTDSPVRESSDLNPAWDRSCPYASPQMSPPSCPHQDFQGTLYIQNACTVYAITKRNAESLEFILWAPTRSPHDLHPCY